jgi:hypothetical protein
MARAAPSIRRLLRLMCAYAVLATLAAPAAFGPALGPMLRELGAQQVHLCKCGMPVGKCGCPDCERLEEQRQRDLAPSVLPALRRHCDDDAPAILVAALPAMALTSSVGVLPVPRGDRVSRLSRDVPPPHPSPDPPTPPPRRVTA